MKDRIPTHPGRVELRPVSGQANIFDMTMADDAVVEGTPPIKRHLLPDEVAQRINSASPPQDVGEAFDKMLDSLITPTEIANVIYPVGSIYISVNAVNPTTMFGGVWERWGNGRVPVGVQANDADFGTVERSGGSRQLQQHTHAFTGSSATSGAPSNNTSGNPNTRMTGGPRDANDAALNTTNSAGAHSHGGREISAGVAAPATNWVGRPNARDGGSVAQNVVASGGAHTHTLSDHRHMIPNHTHTLASHTHIVTATGTNANTGTGNSQNLQPYITCYMWKRVA